MGGTWGPKVALICDSFKNFTFCGGHCANVRCDSGPETVLFCTGGGPLANGVLSLGQTPTLLPQGPRTFRHRLRAVKRHIALSESKMAAKTTSGSGFDPKFGLLAPSFLFESGIVAVYRQILSDFTLRAVRCQMSTVPQYEMRY